METGLFEIHAELLSRNTGAYQSLPRFREVTHEAGSNGPAPMTLSRMEWINLQKHMEADPETVEFARCFLRLVNLPSLALDRLRRYEAMLCRQASRILFALNALDHQKPQERRRRLFGTAQEF